MSNTSESVMASELRAVLSTASVRRCGQRQLGCVREMSVNVRCSKGPGSVSCMSCSLGISYEETS